MKRLLLIIVTLLALVSGIVGCRASLTPSQPPAPPKAGEWVASADFGELRFNINSASDGITKISIKFVQFKCGGVTWESGGVTFENPTPWPISGRKFTAKTHVNPWDFVIQGEFDDSGLHASGIWQVTGKNCSGKWESTRSP